MLRGTKLNYKLQAGDASGTGLFDTPNRTYDKKRMDTIDSRLSGLFPELIGPNDVSGIFMPLHSIDSRQPPLALPNHMDMKSLQNGKTTIRSSFDHPICTVREEVEVYTPLHYIEVGSRKTKQIRAL